MRGILLFLGYLPKLTIRQFDGFLGTGGSTSLLLAVVHSLDEPWVNGLLRRDAPLSRPMARGVGNEEVNGHHDDVWGIRSHAREPRVIVVVGLDRREVDGSAGPREAPGIDAYPHHGGKAPGLRRVKGQRTFR